MRRPANPATDLLFGLIALQVGLIDQSQLVAGFQAWTLDKSKPLAEHLTGLGHLDADDRAAVDAMVSRHRTKHGDTENSLAALDIGSSTREKLARLADPDVDATIAQVGSRSSSATDSTMTYQVGTSTSNGRRFRVLRPHAKGGLGEVFVALDDELRREVALKQVLDHHADNPHNRQRFVLEAEITGGLEHPGIVPVYGLGTYQDGRPYYAMRFIRGDSLKDAIAKYHSGPANAVAFRQLLRRFLDVCNAIEYAHSRGVLHRDLKPGNIIVGKYGETLVVDWGLAKALGKGDPTGEERALVPLSAGGSSETLPGQAIGTPAYMPPEQAQGDLDALGPRSDVYALGATLYCLLVGKAPFEGNDRGGLLRRVEKGEFARPRALDPTIDRALEAIVLKAMATKPEGRYGSSRALADDLEHWLADERVDAFPEPWSRTLNRWLTRHRTAVTGAAAALLVGLVGLGAIAAVQIRARGELDRKNGELTKSNEALDQQRKRAEVREEQAIDAVQRFSDAIAQEPLLKDTPELQELRTRLLKGPLGFFGTLRERLQADNDTRPESLVRLARVLQAHALVTDEVGDPEDGLRALDDSLAIWERLTNLAPEERPYQSGLAMIQNRRARFLSKTGRVAEAKRSFESALAILRKLAADDPTSTHDQGDLATCYNNLGIFQSDTGDLAGARRSYESALAIQRKLADEHPTVVPYQSNLARVHNCLGTLLNATGDFAGARGSFESALAIQRKLADEHPTLMEFQRALASSHTNLGILRNATGDSDGARRSFESALAIHRELAADHPTITAYQSDLAMSHNNLGAFLSAVGDQLGARRSLESAQAIWRKLADDHPTVTNYQSDLAGSHYNLGLLLRTAGDMKAALRSYESAQAIRRAQVEDHPTVPAYQNTLALIHNDLGSLRSATGDLAGALQSYESALAILKKLTDDHPSVPDYQKDLATGHFSLGSLRSTTGDVAGALRSYESALAIRRKLADEYPSVPDYQKDLAGSHNNLGLLLRDTGDLTGARRSYESALAIHRSLVDKHPGVSAYQDALALSHYNLGELLSATDDFAGARRSYESALAIQRMLTEEAPPGAIAFQGALAATHNGLGSLLSNTGDLTGARRSYESALAIRRKLGDDHPESPEYASDLGGTLNNLALLDLDAKRFAEARDRLREAILRQKKALASNPSNPTYRQFLTNHCTALRLAAQGLDDADLLAEAESGLAELNASDPALLALDARIAAILKGEVPEGNDERLALAQRAYDTKRFTLAAKLWAEALESDPQLAADRQAQHPYNAACAAALAGSGQGIDDPAPDDDAKLKLRGQALGWLKGELAVWSKIVESGAPQAKAFIAQTLEHWKKDADLAGVRDGLDQLPDDERAAWRAFWDEVTAQLGRARGDTNIAPSSP